MEKNSNVINELNKEIQELEEKIEKIKEINEIIKLRIKNKELKLGKLKEKLFNIYNYEKN